MSKYTLEDIPVGDLEVDRRVQRTGLEMRKIEKMKTEWNENAEGFYTVSRRKSGQLVILDGAHRWTAKKELTDNLGTAPCRILEGLSLAEEAEIFLALNNTTQPLPIDKFKVRVVKGDPVAEKIDEIVKSYGWVITRAPGDHHIRAVAALEKIYRRSEAADQDPNALTLTMLAVTRAWGNQHAAASAVIVEGMGRLFIEYSSKIVMDTLTTRLNEYKGGPATLHAKATELAAMRQGKVSMAVAELVVEAYNKGKRIDSPTALPTWNKRA